MIDLSGTWRLTDEEGEYSLPARFPGDIHSALLEQGLIPDPFPGRNELKVQWVATRAWIAEREFEVIDARAGDAEERVDRRLLTIDTLDCVAKIEINGRLVWRGTNMFVPVRVDVGPVLQDGSNTIRVTLHSAENVARERAGTLPYPVPHQIYPVQSMHRNLVRKVQCHAGWDWGPALMVSGLYGTIAIVDEPRWSIAAVWSVPRVTHGTRWSVPVIFEVDSGTAHRAEAVSSETPYAVARTPRELPHDELLHEVAVRVLAPDGSEVAGAIGATLDADIDYRCGLFPERVRLTRDLIVEDPMLWWPAGYGDQPLYTVEVTVAGRTRRFQTAFRTIEVVSEADEHGRSLFFRVNGRDVWAKGANWIPIDAFPSRQTEERYRSLLEDTVAVNMNMLRVWGGGQYEQDIFYRICDELGILVWQDFMFSCSLYPSEKWFLDEVREETALQVRRLISHPSIAIWCGNNENVGALGWYPESRKNPGRYLIDYDRLNTGVIAREVRALDDTRVFWPSSPAAGEGDFSDNWHDDSSGDMHYWSVWHEGKPFDAYQEVTPRFCSEFGFQSFPSLHGISTFTGPEQYNPTAPDLEHHQRHPRGNTVVTETMTRYFRLAFGFADFLYLSQVQQALAIRTAVDFWRSRRPVSMGALYWQLNDLWPVVSWSSIEYDGRWKLLHYEARRFFAPLRIVCQVHRDTLETWLANDTEHRLDGDLVLRWISFAGTILDEERFPVQSGPDSVVPVSVRALSDLPFQRVDAFVVAEWEDRRIDVAMSIARPPVERGWAFLSEPKRCELTVPRITIERIDERSVRVQAHEAPAFFVSLESDDPAVRFRDNGFLLLPGETQTVAVDRLGERTGDAVLRVRHVRGTY